MMRSLLIIIIFIGVLGSRLCAQNHADAILGKWVTNAGNCLVEVYKLDTEYRAKVLWFDDKGKEPMNDCVDEKNPDKALRSRKIIGMEVLRNLAFNPLHNEWDNGIIYDATCGKEWDSVAWLTKDNLLKVKGYWLVKWLSKTNTFKRADEQQSIGLRM